MHPEHEHDGGHTHDHSHTAAPRDELIALMRYVVGHNVSHMNEHKKLAQPGCGAASAAHSSRRTSITPSAASMSAGTSICVFLRRNGEPAA